MSAKGRRPSEEDRIAGWTTVDVEAEDKLFGWIAGPIVGVDVHPNKRSKPCLKSYLGNKVPCAGCAVGMRVDWLGYQPIYRKTDGKPCIVCLHRDQFDTADNCPLHAPVQFGREIGVNCGIWLARLLAGAEYDTRSMVRSVAVDISDFLPTIWSLRGVLTGAHLRRERDVPSDNAVSLPTQSRLPDHLNHRVPIDQPGEKPAVEAVEDGDSADLYDALKSQISDRVKRNGKAHKPK